MEKSISNSLKWKSKIYLVGILIALSGCAVKKQDVDSAPLPSETSSPRPNPASPSPAPNLPKETDKIPTDSLPLKPNTSPIDPKKPEDPNNPVVVFNNPTSGCAVQTSKWTGSYNFKFASPAGFIGIEGTVVLPRPIFDPNRYFHFNHENPKHLPSWEGPLDRPSVYVGLANPDPKNKSEIDAGLSWQAIYRTKGQRVLVDSFESEKIRKPEHRYILFEKEVPARLVSPDGATLAVGWSSIRDSIREFGLEYLFGYTPFWRTQILASDSSKLFLPGEKVKLKIQKISNENFELLIHSSHERVSVKFTYPQFAALDTSGFYVKRINAIDQFRLVDGLRKGNEGLEVEVIPTKARALGSKWENVSILKRGGQVLPFTAPSCIHVRGVDTALDYDKIFHYSEINKSSGAQVVDIF